MSLMNFLKPKKKEPAVAGVNLASLLENVSIEVLPKTLAKFSSIENLFPENTRVYIAHINGCDIEDMVAAARRLTRAGYNPMPHFPARLIDSKDQLRDWAERYSGEAGVTQALLLGGGVHLPTGSYDSSMQLLESGIFDQLGFTNLHVAGHPEGNRDIDIDGDDRIVSEALRWKQAFSERTDAEMAIVTQFMFEPQSLISWAEKIQADGISLPVHVGLAGPTKLHTLVKYSIACGVGPSVKVIQKRAADVTKLLIPYSPTEMAESLAVHQQDNPTTNIRNVHIFPLGGIEAAAAWIAQSRSSEI